jgi:hypothetical protein
MPLLFLNITFWSAAITMKNIFLEERRGLGIEEVMQTYDRALQLRAS